MHSYRERLTAPVSWWVTGMVTMFTFGSIVWFGFPLWAALVTYAILFAVTAAFLLNWGRASIEVTETELVAGGQRLALAAAGEVLALGEARTRALLGPHADPEAHVLIRPYLRRAVYIEVARPDGGAPYWLLATKRPAELAAAVTAAAVAAGAAGGPAGVAAHAADLGKERPAARG